MIIQLESAAAENVEAAKSILGAITRSWGHEIAEIPAEVTVYLISRSRSIELRTLTPDHLIDLLADKDPAG